MYMKQRREQILEYIKAHNSVSVETLAELFSVTSRTIRNDLAYLVSFGLIQRMHGGAAFTHHALLTQLAGDENNDFSKLLRSVNRHSALEGPDNNPRQHSANNSRADATRYAGNHKYPAENKHGAKNQYAISNRDGAKNQFDSDNQSSVIDTYATATNSGTLHKKNRGGRVCVLGTFFVDIVTKVDHLPKNGGELLLASDISFGPGGKGANQALAAAAAGARVHFVAKVGTDQFSKMAYDHLISSGIDSFMLYQTPEASTGCSIIYVSQEQGENIIAISPGANKKITDGEIAAMYAKLSETDIFLLHTGNNMAAITGAIKLAHLLNVMVILNPAPFTEDIRPCLPLINIIIPNITAASLLSGIEVNSLTTAKAAAKAIHGLGVKTVIITLGGLGALLFFNSTYYHFPAYPSVQVDTTGAGDAFCGAFSAMMAQGGNIFHSVNYATAFASLVVEKEGASNMPAPEEIRHRLKENASVAMS